MVGSDCRTSSRGAAALEADAPTQTNDVANAYLTRSAAHPEFGAGGAVVTPRRVRGARRAYWTSDGFGAVMSTGWPQSL